MSALTYAEFRSAPVVRRDPVARDTFVYFVVALTLALLAVAVSAPVAQGFGGDVAIFGP